MTQLTASRRRLQKIRERAAATRFARSLHRGRALATHAIAAGVTDPDTVDGVKAGLAAAAKRLGIKPVKVVRAHRTIRGKEKRTRSTHHFTVSQVGRMLRSYKPRKAEYKAAVVLMILAQGAPVTVRQSVRPAAVRQLSTV